MSSIASIISLVDSSPSQVKRDGLDYSFWDILHGLRDAGIPCNERRLYKVLKGLSIQKSDRGWYSAADVAAIVGWLKRGNAFSSYREYWASCGQRLHNFAEQHYA
jgi:hypothetical protein